MLHRLFKDHRNLSSFVFLGSAPENYGLSLNPLTLSETLSPKDTAAFFVLS